MYNKVKTVFWLSIAFFFFTLFALEISVASAAVAYDSSLNCGNSTTCSFTNTAGNYMVVELSSCGSDTVLGVSYGGSPLSLEYKKTGTAGCYAQYTYTLASPATGANNLVITGTADAEVVATYSGYTSVDSTNHDSGSFSGSYTQSITPAGTAFLVWGSGNGGTGPADGTNATVRIANNGGAVGIADSNADACGTTSMTVNVSGSNGWSGAIIALTDSVGCGGGGGGATTTVATTTAAVVTQDEVLFILGLVLFFVGVVFFESALTVTSKRYEI